LVNTNQLNADTFGAGIQNVQNIVTRFSGGHGITGIPEFLENDN
jgi:hypothetical protein